MKNQGRTSARHISMPSIRRRSEKKREKGKSTHKREGEDHPTTREERAKKRKEARCKRGGRGWCVWGREKRKRFVTSGSTTGVTVMDQKIKMKFEKLT